MRYTIDLIRRVASAHLIFLLALPFVSAAKSQSVSSAQRVTIVAGTPAGGAYDLFARLIARHLGGFLPGNPSVVVQNMPGAGSLIAANWLANSAPKDGTAIAVLPNATLFEALLGNTNAHFDAIKLNILGSLSNSDPVAFVWAQTPFVTAQDLFTHEVLTGASGASANNSILPNLLNSLIHTRFKVVNGYPGSASIELALERGEVQADVGPDWDYLKSMKSDWLRDKKIRVLLQATLARHKELPEVPTALDLVSPENRDVLALLLARQTYAGLLFAPPDVPGPVVGALRQAFLTMTRDTEFNHDAEQINLSLNPSSAAQISAALDKIMSSPQPVIDRATAELRRVDPQ